MRKSDKAFLLRMIKYGETSAVLDFFTESSGRIQLMGKGVMNQKKRQNLFLLSENEIEFGESRNPDSLGNSYSIVPTYICREAYSNPIIANLLLFVAEFYVQNTDNNHKDDALYRLLKWSVERLESKANIKYFPQEFLHHWGIINGSDWDVMWAEALMLNKNRDFHFELYVENQADFTCLSSKESRWWAFDLTLQILKSYDLIKTTEYRAIDALHFKK